MQRNETTDRIEKLIGGSWFSRDGYCGRYSELDGRHLVLDVCCKKSYQVVAWSNDYATHEKVLIPQNASDKVIRNRIQKLGI